MIVLMNLSKKNNDEAIYQFGCNKIDGLIRIDLKDIDNSQIVNMPSDELVYDNYANKALAKLAKLALNNEFPNKTQYVS